MSMPDASASHSIVSGMMTSRPLTFDDRLLAEAAAIREQLEPGGSAIDDRSANDVARSVGGDFEQRLIVRSESLPFASALRDALHRVRQSIGLAIFVALVIACVSGAAAARAALGAPRDEPVNFFHVLAAALGVQTLLLIIWIALMCLPRSAATAMSIASLGGLVLRGGQALARKVHPGRDYAAVIAAMSRLLARTPLGRWTFSAVSHALWLMFNVGCLAMIIFLLSTRQYAFAWETTILSADTYRPLTRAIAALPMLVGFDAPSDAQIDASQWTGEGPVHTKASQAWSALLVGSIIVYGFGPRLLLLALCLGQRRAARARYRLDVDRPEFARLRGVLEPAAVTTIVDADVASPEAASSSQPLRRPAPRPVGLPAIVGFELPALAGDRDRANWPPRVHGVRWRDLGMVDTREDRRRVIDDLSRSPEEPSALLIVCSLTTTPDRGAGAFLAELAATVARRPALLLTGGQRLRERADHARLEARIYDWRAIASRAAIPADRIIELDLDHLTQNTQAKLAALIGGDDHASPTQHQRRLEEAFSLIVEHARDRGGSASAPVDPAAMHRDIARLYGDHAIDWRGMFRLPADVTSVQPARLAAALESNAARFTALLPDRLKRSPKWLAAGATAGALGCITAAALISPVAISALPVWSLIGAAVSAVVQPSSLASDSPDESPAKSDIGAIVQSAALFAMLLELQGRDEPTITRVLDRAIPEADAVGPQSAADVQRWLDGIRHRFDLALAQEAAS